MHGYTMFSKSYHTYSNNFQMFPLFKCKTQTEGFFLHTLTLTETLALHFI